jgi:hypothetical protein
MAQTSEERFEEIMRRYDFEEGRDQRTQKYAAVDNLLKVADEAYEINKKGFDMKRPHSSRPESELWEIIGGKRNEAVGALRDLLDADDQIGKIAALELLATLRRKARDRIPTREHILIVAELCAREWEKQTQTPGDNKIRRAAIRQAMWRPERRARWELLRFITPDAQRKQAGSAGPRR